MRDRDDVLAVLRAQEDATARGDAAGVVAVMADDIVAYDLPPPLEVRGAAAYEASGLEQWFATWDGGVTVALADPTVLVAGDLAVVFGLSRMRGVKRGAGPLDQWSRRTVVLQRRADGWRMVHDHGSFPMLMDGSDKAATDLRPDGDAG
jgi:ketosteroid isomerase-like protein